MKAKVLATGKIIYVTEDFGVRMTTKYFGSDGHQYYDYELEILSK